MDVLVCIGWLSLVPQNTVFGECTCISSTVISYIFVVKVMPIYGNILLEYKVNFQRVFGTSNVRRTVDAVRVNKSNTR